MNAVTSKFAPKLITKLEAAAAGYAEWKQKHSPGHFPWRGLSNPVPGCTVPPKPLRVQQQEAAAAAAAAQP